MRDSADEGRRQSRRRRKRETGERSGDFSGDERFDPDALFDVIATTDNAEHATEAIRSFIAKEDEESLRLAIAIYTRSARARGKSVENVLADLNGLTDRQSGRYEDVGRLLEPSELKKLVLGSILEGFTSDERAERGS
jgi:hypothetical protein